MGSTARAEAQVLSAEQARAGTTLVTVTALGLVLGLSSAAVLPLLLPWRGAALLVACCVTLALLPFGGAAVVVKKRGGALPRLGWAALSVALLSALALLPLWNLYRGRVRVLNHGDEPFMLVVDGKRVTRVEPSSGESALAGVEVWMPAGSRELRVLSELDGRDMFRMRAQVSGGSPHLFAPLSAPQYCFSIERRGYGDAQSEPLASEPLEGADPFWELPDGIAWFTPNPEPGPFETSGGTLSCLRQRRCDR